MLGYLMLFLLSFLSFLLIVIILLQRGRGGGLAGALGGAGGQSAFGTKAGDVFTKITVILAIIWVIFAGVSIIVLTSTRPQSYRGGADANPDLISGDEDPAASDRPALGGDEPLMIPEGTTTPAGTSSVPSLTPPAGTSTTPALTPPAATSSSAAPAVPAGTSTPAGTSDAN
ncbi:preprotein translocase subunit SecG [Rubinisphaera margarita]|uniref:preprotein translocase subunit SecG n=1 Tax=Rubinisphaera margarita TaxID=2909586 RepID=UPI001EE7E49D|nr:preprotein translocase subunit SecG [Rubinisphaera margarita]MCG6156947.1 preprotein translocase subunit SecG [Rubinisphaera margarita]